MRKHIIVLIIILSAIPLIIKKSDYRDVTNVINVNSIGFNFNIETREYEIYFYVINNFNITNSKIASSNLNNLSYLIKVSDKDFYTTYNNLYNKVNEYISFNHLKTVILSINFINKDNLTLFYNLIKNNTKFYYNFFVFTTASSLDEIYNIKNFSDVSAYHTILTTPNLIFSYNLVTYNKFINIILNDNYSILLPNIKLNKDTINSDSENLYTLEINGYSYFTKNNYVDTFLTNDNSFYKWIMNLNNQNIKIDEYNIYIKSYKNKFKFKDNKLTITIKISAILISELNDKELIEIENLLNNIIRNDIKILFDSTFYNNIDIYNIKYLYPSCNNVDFIIKLNLN